MSEALGSLQARFREDPRIRWGAAIACALENVPMIGYLFWLKGATEMKAVLFFSAMIFVFHAWIFIGILTRWALTSICAQWGSGIGIAASSILLLKSMATRMPDDVPTIYLVGSLALCALQFTLVTLTKPAKSPTDAGRTGEFGLPKSPKSTDPLEWTRDNIEAIVVAFLMALIIRCYCVEVFKIPTGSMEPTLYGDTKPGEPPPAHQGDRIMVDKVGLMLHGVNRFDVCVFKYPLDRSRNFIKRLVGLPDEDFQISHGDIFTRPHSGGDGKFHIARKPPNEQTAIWLPAWPDEDVSADRCRKAWDGAPAACYSDGAVFDTAPAKGEATFRFHGTVKDWYRERGTQGRVSDSVVRFRATMAAGSELFVTNARSDGYGRFTTTIGADGTIRFSQQPDAEGTFVPLPPPAPASAGAIAPGAAIEVAVFDGAVRVSVGGREVAAWEYVDALPAHLHQPDAPAFQLMFGSAKGAVKFEGLWIGRDILYSAIGCMSGREYMEIPKDRYFAIGDNVGNSKDGRLWKERVVKLKNGLTMTGDLDSPEIYPQLRAADGLPERFRDLDGTDHFFMAEDVDDPGELDGKWHPFIAREELVGKALVVWWPLSRFKMIR